jgi:hypothetical protein
LLGLLECLLEPSASVRAAVELASVLEVSTGEVPLQPRQQMDLKQLEGMCSGSLQQLHHLEKPFFQLQQAYRLRAAVSSVTQVLAAMVVVEAAVFAVGAVLDADVYLGVVAVVLAAE